MRMRMRGRGGEPIEEREEEDDGDEGSRDERNRGSQVESHRNINMERTQQNPIRNHLGILLYFDLKFLK